MSKIDKFDIKIVEFKPEYQKQIIDVIGKGLMELEVIPKSDKPLQDKDLYKISKVYKDRGKFWVALREGKVVGTVAIRDMGNNVAKLNRMFVLNDLHGTEVGQSLFDCAIKHAKQQGFKEIILNTHPLMKRAHHFYSKNNFKKVDEHRERYHYKLGLQ